MIFGVLDLVLATTFYAYLLVISTIVFGWFSGWFWNILEPVLVDQGVDLGCRFLIFFCELFELLLIGSYLIDRFLVGGMLVFVVEGSFYYVPSSITYFLSFNSSNHTFFCHSFVHFWLTIKWFLRQPNLNDLEYEILNHDIE